VVTISSCFNAFTRKYRSHLVIALCLFIAALYWFSTHPSGWVRGYIGDFCVVGDSTRQLMAENLRAFGSPRFTTTNLMAPNGVSIPFMPWSIEQHWLGAIAWNLNRDFPFLWSYFGFSIFLSILVVGALLRKIGIRVTAAVAIATFLAVFNVPRHLKAWHHYEHLLHHWLLISIFIDVVIWKRLIVERRWSASLEAWRGFALVGMLGTAGYLWGPLILEWFVLRAFAWAFLRASRRLPSASRLKFRLDWKNCIVPLALTIVWLVVEAQWFIPLFTEYRKFGEVDQNISYGAHLGYFVRPLFWEDLLALFHKTPVPIYHPETAITIGWSYLIPWIAGLVLLKRNRGKHGLWLVGPFLTLTLIGLVYATLPGDSLFHRAIQAVVPFMSFFRVKSRWGLYLPALIMAQIVLCWPLLTERFSRLLSKKPAYLLPGILLLFSEAKWLAFPVNTLPEPGQSFFTMLEGIRKLPGTTVLDLPFCVVGGNFQCSPSQCNDTQAATIGQCLREWHDKKVYGVYQSRINDAQCKIYQGQPMSSWFTAWTSGRCFTAKEWDQFCSYLDSHQEITALLVYPEIWNLNDGDACIRDFARRLGPPLGQTRVAKEGARAGQWKEWTRILHYEPKCITTR